MWLGSSDGLVSVAEAIGTDVDVIVGVSVLVGVSVSVAVGVFVGVLVGVRVAVGGSVGVRLAIGLAVGTAVISWAALTGVVLLVEGSVAAKGVTAAVDWQAASSKRTHRKTDLRIIINSNSNVRSLHHL